MGDRLEEGKLTGPVAQEHGLLLRQLLLPVPEYCQEASTDAFASASAYLPVCLLGCAVSCITGF